MDSSANVAYEDSLAGLKDRREFVLEESAIIIEQLIKEYYSLPFWSIFKKRKIIVRLMLLFHKVGWSFTQDGYEHYAQFRLPALRPCYACGGRGYMKPATNERLYELIKKYGLSPPHDYYAEKILDPKTNLPWWYKSRNVGYNSPNWRG